MREAQIEKAVCDYAKTQGWLVHKFVSPNNRGVPDRILMRDEEVIFIEFKAPGKKTTKLQDRQIAKIRNAGIEVFVVDDIETGKRIVGDEIHGQ